MQGDSRSAKLGNELVPNGPGSGWGRSLPRHNPVLIGADGGSRDQELSAVFGCRTDIVDNYRGHITATFTQAASAQSVMDRYKHVLAQTIQPLVDGLFGDYVSSHDGNTFSYVTDVMVHGNGAIPVSEAALLKQAVNLPITVKDQLQ